MKNRNKKIFSLLAISAIIMGCTGDESNKKVSSEEQEIIFVSKKKKIFEPGEHVVRFRERINTTSEYDRAIIVPEGYEYNKDMIFTNSGDLIYSFTNVVEVEAIGKKNSLTGRIQYDDFGTPTNKMKHQANENDKAKTLELKKH